MHESYIFLFSSAPAGTHLAHQFTMPDWKVITFNSLTAFETAVSKNETPKPELIIFDASELTEDPLEAYSRVQKLLPQVKTIYIRDADMIEDYSLGANLYLEKPFTKRKLVNRVRTLLPANPLREEIIQAGHITLLLGKPSVKVGGRPEQRLTPKLKALLLEFFKYPDRVLSRKELMKTVWQTDFVDDTRTLDVHICWVRELIEEDPAEPKIIQTVRGIGYKFSLN